MIRFLAGFPGEKPLGGVPSLISVSALRLDAFDCRCVSTWRRGPTLGDCGSSEGCGDRRLDSCEGSAPVLLSLAGRALVTGLGDAWRKTEGCPLTGAAMLALE